MTGPTDPETTGEVALPQPPGMPSRQATVRAAVRGWQAELSALGGPNTLLWQAAAPGPVLDLTTAHPGGVAKLLAGSHTRLSELVREPRAFSQALETARLIAQHVHDMAHEHGLATGVLGLGRATWEVGAGEPTPAAPALLRHCRLTALSGRTDYAVELRGDAILNPALTALLRRRGVRVDEDALVALTTAGGGFDPYPMYAALQRQGARLPGFRVSPRLVIAPFPLHKMRMVGDLTALADSAAGHPVVAALAGDADALHALRKQVLPDIGDELDEVPVLDLDGPQWTAVRHVLAGRDLVVEAPRGTGATQVAAAAVAELAEAGRSVLLLSEHAAEARSVLDRLRELGLGTGEPTAVEPGAAAQDEDAARGRERRAREVLSRQQRALHRPREPWGVTAYQVQERIAQLGSGPTPPRTRVRVDRAALDRLSPAERDRCAGVLEAAARDGAWSTGPDPDPWFAADIRDPQDATRARSCVGRLLDGARLDQLVTGMTDACLEAGVPAPRTLSAAGTVLEMLHDAGRVAEVFRPGVYDAPLTDLVGATGDRAYRRDHEIGLSSLARRRLQTQARSLVRDGVPAQDVHEHLARAQRVRVQWRTLCGADARPGAVPDVARLRELHAAVVEDVGWLGEHCSPDAPAVSVHEPYAELRSRLMALQRAGARLDATARNHAGLQDLRRAGLDGLVRDLAARRVSPEQVRPELEFLWWASISEELMADEDYGPERASDFHRAVRDLARADGCLVQARQRRLARARAGRGHVRVATPLRVAERLSSTDVVDTVIILGAERTPLAAVVAAICRARQVVAIGDPALPGPQPYAVSGGSPALRAGGRVGTAGTSALEALGQVLPVTRLRTQRRMTSVRLARLLQPAYDPAPLVLPCAREHRPVTLELHPDATGEPGQGTGVVDSPHALVRAVVELVLGHCEGRSTPSLAVVTLTETHAQDVTRALDALRLTPAQEAAVHGGPGNEGVRVVPAARAGALERDRVIISIGLGRNASGEVVHRFGPLDAGGGERLVTAALGVARSAVTVVSAFGADELSTDLVRSDGARALHRLLAATSGSSSLPEEAEDRPVSALQDGFVRRLRETGLTVDEDVVGVPGSILVTPGRGARSGVVVETDGPMYAAPAPWRDRVRLRGQDLDRRGLGHVRVRTTDLYCDPAREVARVIEVVQERDRLASEQAAAARRAERQGRQ